MLTNLLGGIGLFLIGMVLLTEGLKAAAGDDLKRVLVRFTGGPIRSLLAGAGVTALVQSSSATTLTTIGFVSAGLLTFPQAVGVIFGANLGTTSTAWLVAVFGLKMSVLPAALPMVGAGALLRLLGRGRLAHVGLALAGFGLIFVGIDTLQLGMSGLADRVGPDRLDGATVGASLLLVLLGVAMTVVMQSTSAAVATTLTALSTGTIGVAQAAALVIGQNVGTTVTAGLAAIGASVPARRTALAHVLFNVSTAAVALALLPGVPRVAAWATRWWGESNDALFLAAFQTGFNLLGVAMLLPVTDRFARLITRLVPDRGPPLTRYLDRSVTRVSAVAVETAHRTLREILAAVLQALALTRPTPSPARQQALRDALAETRRFLAAVHPESESASGHERHVAAIHALDHLEQLVGLLGAPARTEAADSAGLVEQRALAAEVLAYASGWLGGEVSDAADRTMESLGGLRALARHDRVAAIDAAAAGQVDPDVVIARLDAMRWLDAVAQHVHRAVHHLASADVDATLAGEVPPREEVAPTH